MSEKKTPQPLWTRDFTIITLGSVISMFGNAMSGMGYYIQFNARFAEYTKVVSGIILAGVFIGLVNSLFRKDVSDFSPPTSGCLLKAMKSSEECCLTS